MGRSGRLKKTIGNNTLMMEYSFSLAQNCGAQDCERMPTGAFLSASNLSDICDTPLRGLGHNLLGLERKGWRSYVGSKLTYWHND